jgi:NAD(P)-dependent dehydrogenase (short-subunit alcohol dehydrogenase family)
MQTLQYKTALITGAGAGLGHEICKSLNERKATIFAVARNKEDLQKLACQLNDRRHQFFSIDLSTDEGQQLLLLNLEKFGFPHIVVANINIPPHKRKLIHTSKEIFSENFTVNIDHLLVILEKTLCFQRKEKFGRWVGISSMATHTGLPGKAISNAQKAAMESMFLNIATEEGKFGITANIVAPGFIMTPSIERTIPKEIQEKISIENVMKRAGTPEEVAAAVTFFASPEASYITGATLPVCGGAHLAWNF